MFSAQRLRYLKLLSKEYPSRYDVYARIINLKAELSMPKGTEHFISDIHGEYEAFYHILNNASGVIKDKVKHIFPEFDKNYLDNFCTLIYYPRIVIDKLKKEGRISKDFYHTCVFDLIKTATFMSSKYSRSSVRAALNPKFARIIDELMHAQADEDDNRKSYHNNILKAIVDTGSAEYFIEVLCEFIKCLSVEKLHVLGDIFDRGASPDKCMDLLMNYHNLDLQWGNHDVLWMGAYCGSALCAFNVVLNNLRYHNFTVLENGYGISLRKLALFSAKHYENDSDSIASYKAASVIGAKLLGQFVDRNPDFDMDDYKILSHIDKKNGTITLNDGHVYTLKLSKLDTIDENDPYALTPEEQEVVNVVVNAFKSSKRLEEHIRFLFTKGDMYLCTNGNLLYHGCVPLDENGEFKKIHCEGKYLSGKEYFDYCRQKIREGFLQRDDRHLDFYWYMWTARLSPLSGRRMKIFEKIFIKEEEAHEEPRNPYYEFYHSEATCKMILKEFGLSTSEGHIINGHTPIFALKGESPIRAKGRLLVIDGGFCKAYQSKTGIAGYTLIYNSHGLNLKALSPFTSTQDAIENHTDISDLQILDVAHFKKRRMVADTDKGAELKQKVRDLEDLLSLFEDGTLPEKY